MRPTKPTLTKPSTTTTPFSKAVYNGYPRLTKRFTLNFWIRAPVIRGWAAPTGLFRYPNRSSSANAPT